jgi:hypothetical protein
MAGPDGFGESVDAGSAKMCGRASDGELFTR